MAVQVSSKKTSKFIDHWAYFPWGIAAILFLAIFFSGSTTKVQLNKEVKATEEEPVKVGTLELDPKKPGALKIDVKSSFPSNHWVVYELQLVDQQGQVIASAIDEAWWEKGTWREQGESGTWSKSDLLGGLDLKSQNLEKIDLVIAVLESGTRAGQSANLTVSFRVNATSGVIQTKHLFWGSVCSAILGILAIKATKVSGQKVISRKIADSDPKGRTVLGGEDRLIHVQIKTRFDENVPSHARINLRINNGLGEKVYDNTERIVPKITKVESLGAVVVSKIDIRESFFIFQERGSYSFQVQVEPDQPVEWTSLDVREGAQSLTAIDVAEIKQIPASGKQKHITME